MTKGNGTGRQLPVTSRDLIAVARLAERCRLLAGSRELPVDNATLEAGGGGPSDWDFCTRRVYKQFF